MLAAGEHSESLREADSLSIQTQKELGMPKTVGGLSVYWGGRRDEGCRAEEKDPEKELGCEQNEAARLGRLHASVLP